MRKFLRWLFNTLAFISLIFGVAHFLRVRSARGLILRAIKAVSEGLSPILAVAGALSAFGALVLHAPLTALAGVAGALLQARYIRNVTRPHTAFEEPFGPDWQIRLENKIPAYQRAALLRQRWRWRMPRSNTRPVWDRDMVYHLVPGQNGAPDTPLHCDLWLPPESIPTTGLGIIYVHGGGYYTTQKDFGTRPFFRHLVSQGHMAMDINYRLGSQASFFDMLSDVMHAVAWLKENAVLFGIDANKIVLAGGSAGAHLALLAAYAHDNQQLVPPDLAGQDLSVHAVVSYYGVIDMISAYQRMQKLFTAMLRRPIPERLFDRPMFGRTIAAAAWVRGVEPQALKAYMQQNQAVLSSGLDQAMQRLLGGSPDEVPEVFNLISPLVYAGPGCPPTLLFQGAHDYLLPTSITRKLHHRLRAAGVPTVYVELAQTEHTFDQFLPEWSPPAQVALYDLDRFLALIG